MALRPGCMRAYERGARQKHTHPLRAHTVAQHCLEKGQLVARVYLPLNEWPASASNAAEFINHPAAPLALVKRTFAPNPTSVTRLPRSPSRRVRQYSAEEK